MSKQKNACREFKSINDVFPKFFIHDVEWTNNV